MQMKFIIYSVIIKVSLIVFIIISLSYLFAKITEINLFSCIGIGLISANLTELIYENIIKKCIENTK